MARMSPSIFGASYSLDLHAKQLQQCREDAHVVEQKDIVSGPVEHIHLCVTLVKHSWGKRWEKQCDWLTQCF